MEIPNTIIYNGINLDNFKIFTTEEITSLRKRFDHDSKSIILLFSGRIHPSKGIRELFLSFKFLNDFKIKLLVTGELKTNYGYDPDFEKELKKNLSENIYLLGLIPQEILPKYYAICDYIVVPSKSPEGLPKVITEAVVMGKPVIASDCGGTVELIEDGVNGIIIEEPLSPENIAKAIHKAIKNSNKISQYSAEHTKVNRPRFSSEVMAEQFDNVLKYYQGNEYPDSNHIRF